MLVQQGHRKQFLAHLWEACGDQLCLGSAIAVLWRASGRVHVENPTYLFLSALTLALGTSNRQFGQ